MTQELVEKALEAYRYSVDPRPRSDNIEFRKEHIKAVTAIINLMVDEGAKVANKAAIPPECERANLDYSTGQWECSLERNGKVCLCSVGIEKAEEIAAAILALKVKA